MRAPRLTTAEKERRIGQVIDELIELCDDNKNEAGRRMKKHKMKSKTVGRRGPSYGWAKKELSALADALVEVWRDRDQDLPRHDAVAKIKRLVAGKGSPPNPVAGRHQRPNPQDEGSILLLDALATYSKMDGMSLDRMARAFEVFHRDWPELGLLP